MRELLRRISGTSTVDVMAARIIVEPHAAAAPAVNATKADLASIRRAHEGATFEINPASFHVPSVTFAWHSSTATSHEEVQVGAGVCLHDMINIERFIATAIEACWRRAAPAAALQLLFAHMKF
jgi:hypothetical protein